MNSKATVGIPLDEYFCISIKPKTKASPGDAFWLRFRVSLSAVSCASHVTAGLIRFAGENMSFICRSWLLFCGWIDKCRMNLNVCRWKEWTEDRSRFMLQNRFDHSSFPVHYVEQSFNSYLVGTFWIFNANKIASQLLSIFILRLFLTSWIPFKSRINCEVTSKTTTMRGLQEILILRSFFS